MGTLNHRATDYYTAIQRLVHCPLTDGLLHLVQQEGLGGAAARPVPSSLCQM